MTVCAAALVIVALTLPPLDLPPEEPAQKQGTVEGHLEWPQRTPLRSFRAECSAYVLTGRTSSGTFTHSGTVAVDPSVIRMGSQMTIEGFGGVFTAEDRGSAVVGNRIDIWMSSYQDAIAYGRRPCTITMIQ